MVGVLRGDFPGHSDTNDYTGTHFQCLACYQKQQDRYVHTPELIMKRKWHEKEI